MSSKLEKDDEIDPHDDFQIEPSSEEVAEIVFSRAIMWMAWKDIRTSSFVCKGWNRYITGALVAHPVYAQKFRETFTDDQRLLQFHRWRSDSNDKTHEQCLLLVLEAQMLLRELAEYKKPDTVSDRLFSDIRDQLSKLNFGDDDEADLLAKIQKLRNELVTAFARNDALEKEQKKLEHTIGLLIQHRTSIYELDRAKRNRQRKALQMPTDLPLIHKDPQLKKHYSNLFYLIRTEPRYVAKLAYLIPNNKKEQEQFANVIILRLYANAFSPLEEFLLLDLLVAALEKEVSSIDTIDEFVSSENVVARMIIGYNSRKQGKQYVRTVLTTIIKDLITNPEAFGVGPGGAPKLDILSKYCEVFFNKILETVDKVPYGFRLICKNIHRLVSERFKDNPKQLKYVWRAVGYYVYFRFVGLAIVRPDDFGVVTDDEVNEVVALNLIAVSKVLKTTFMLSEEASGPYAGMNDWIEERHEKVREYLQNVIDVPSAEEYLQVNKYGQLARKEKASIVLPIRDICYVHGLLSEHRDHITEGKDDYLCQILDDLGPAPQGVNDETDIQLELENRFPPILDKLEQKKNLKTQTIDDAIRVLRKIPGFAGDTFLEIFVRMKLYCKKHGQDELAQEVNQVIANLQNLAKYGLVSPKDGFNSFLKDIAAEIQSRHVRRQEQLKEVERLKFAITELDSQKQHMEQKMKDFGNYLVSVQNRANAGFQVKTKKFKYRDLDKAKVISDSEIPPPQQSKVVFEIIHTEPEKFEIKGKIKGIPGFSRNFTLQLQDLLTAKENNESTFDTEKGIELFISSTLIFLNKQFYAQARK
eukprot:TRINITY_DN5777_c0_g1_i3.p1 TRINITY_DN5777_c0_g1~~TRINITY_DN5777_c0_g1_i3.p1  ORF type:complete len:812 (+),score=181.46 TRINITY_DN5777_c0_g1_i3:92-2527(+)